MDMHSSTKCLNDMAAGLKDGNSGYIITMDTCGRTCANCKTPSGIKRCSGCFQVFYCSKQCQRAHWGQHKEFCRKQQTSGDLNVNIGDGGDNAARGAFVSTCQNCKATASNMKKCSRCSVATYCSKACQQVDWPKHKASCKQPSKEKGQQESDYEAGKMFEELARVLDPSRGQSTGTAKLTWAQACEETMRRHPDKRIVTRIVDVTHEHNMNVVQVASCVFLGRLARPHPYIFRQGWYLEDSIGAEIRVFFYLDHDRPEPYFQWSQLEVGGYLCLEHAYIHVFLDSSTGFRVDEASDVSLIGATVD